MIPWDKQFDQMYNQVIYWSKISPAQRKKLDQGETMPALAETRCVKLYLNIQMSLVTRSYAF